ncbi:hypothetical protein EX30DRAFT_339970 [Ascodesmis nigricans]|uniref:Uncharacterized protein n=1 Tax=Ascodesmis nigricans TaxID=341454 RepID=A0A4S2MZ80_9PEZI|nr:hypothetical protein EX30DRAFT_339970 [Ascodesmis nigricans]
MAFNSRWLSTTKSRLGKLFFHGCETSETRAAGELLKKLTENWREYVAGSEGFLTGTTSHGGKGHGPGLFRREVVWGDEVRAFFKRESFGG